MIVTDCYISLPDIPSCKLNEMELVSYKALFCCFFLLSRICNIYGVGERETGKDSFCLDSDKSIICLKTTGFSPFFKENHTHIMAHSQFHLLRLKRFLPLFRHPGTGGI